MDQQIIAVGGGSNTATLLNADKTIGQGFELDLEAYLTDSLLVTLGSSYNDTEIDDPGLAVPGCGGGCTVTDEPVFDPITGLPTGTYIIDGNPLPQAPKWVHNVTARYGIPVGDNGEFFVYTDWAYRSEVNFFLYESEEFTRQVARSKAACASATTGMSASTKSPCSAATSPTRRASSAASTSTT